MTAKTWSVIPVAIALILSSRAGSSVQLERTNTNATHDHAQFVARITQLETRVEQLEIQLPLMFAMTAKPDKNAILRDITGRAIGYWGIDGDLY